MLKIAKGIDVSSHQKIINWSKVKAAGIDFAIIRAAYGTNMDIQFERNISECNRLQIPCGIYVFSYALNEAQAKAEARFALDLIRPYRVDYPVCYDFEYDSVRWGKDNGVLITKEMATSFADTFLSEIEQAGYYAVNYANKDYLNNYFDMEILKKYDLWYAWWNPADKPDRECGLWQYTSQGTVSGITGKVDMNYAFKDYPTIIKKTGLNHLPENIYILKKELEQTRAELAAIKNDINSLAAPVAVINMILEKHNEQGEKGKR